MSLKSESIHRPPKQLPIDWVLPTMLLALMVGSIATTVLIVGGI
jgi:hypothetical protein